MTAPLRDDDHQARADLEADCVEAEKRYAIERHEQLARHHDFASADRAPRVRPDEGDDPGLDIPSSCHPRVVPGRARMAALLNRIFASRSTSPTDADGGAGGRNLGQAGPATTSTKGTA